MPKAKRYKGARLTRQVTLPQKRAHQKEHGRPKGTLKKYSFEQTRLGFMLKYECPAIYEVIRRMITYYDFVNPTVGFIEIVCRNSSDSSLKKAKFQRYLQEYREGGIYCRRAKRMTPQRELYYERIRQNKLRSYLKRNKKRVVRELIW